MGWRSTANRYGTVAVFIHWTTAIAVVILLVSGFRAAGMSSVADKTALLRMHVAVGISVLLLTGLRLAWWWLVDRKPADPEGSPRWQALAASVVHKLFYLLILVMAASGLGMLVLSGAGNILFAGASGPLPVFTHFAPRIPHGIGARVLIALIVVHLCAALYHQLVRQDGLLARMGLGR
jgi:cytochrome b561